MVSKIEKMLINKKYKKYGDFDFKKDAMLEAIILRKKFGKDSRVIKRSSKLYRVYVR